MTRLFRSLAVGWLVLSPFLVQAQALRETAASCARTYENWRQAMIRKDGRSWQNHTSLRRRTEVQNRLVSEKLPFPQAMFDLPAAPPTIRGLKLVAADVQGRAAKLTWFGKVDFGVGGEPTDNLYVVSFLKEGTGWKYDGAEFVSLAVLPEVRDQLAKDDLSYVQTADFKASRPGISPPLVRDVDFVAKVYAFCPGRAVDVVVNGSSKHRFQNTKQAEVVIGGAKLGRNQISFKTRQLEGGKGNEAFTVRIYLMPLKQGVPPIKIYEYIKQEGEAVQAQVQGGFATDAAMKARLE